MTGTDPAQVRAVLAAGLSWLYDTVQPHGAIVSHHGVFRILGERSYRFIPANITNPGGLPVVVCAVARPHFDENNQWRLTNPIDGPAEIDAFAALLAELGPPVVDRWNGQEGCTSGSLQLGRRAHPTLLAAVDTYHAGCLEHPQHSVFCRCGWYQAGTALSVDPVWPVEVAADAA